MTGPDPSGPRPADALVQEYLREAKLSQLRALGLLYRHGTANAAARANNESYNSLAAQVKRANDWFQTHAGVDLIDTVSGRIELTNNGNWIASKVEAMESVLKSMFEGLQGSSIALQVPCTSDCIDSLATFVRAIDQGAPSRSFATWPVETAHFDPMSCGDLGSPVLSLGSKYVSGRRLALPDYVRVLPLRARPIVAIMNEGPGSGKALELGPLPISLNDLLRARVKVLTSIGGVIWDFLEEHAPSVTYGLRNHSHIVVHDLHYGLKCLSTQIERRGVMFVHGVEEALINKSERYPPMNDLQCFPLRESTSDENFALTAVFYNTRAAKQCDSRVQQAYESLWLSAQATVLDSTSNKSPV